jgi:hypothetical protein
VSGPLFEPLTPMTHFMLSRSLQAEYCIVPEVDTVVTSSMSLTAHLSVTVSTFDAVYFVLLRHHTEINKAK